MATLKTAFVQTYHNYNSCYSLLASLPAILTSLLNCDDPAPQLTDQSPPNSQPQAMGERSLLKLSNFKSSKASWASTNCSSLHSIMDEASSDFKSGQQDCAFVHALELAQEGEREVYDFDTVVSDTLSQPAQAESTEISFSSDFDCSDAEDF